MKLSVNTVLNNSPYAEYSYQGDADDHNNNYEIYWKADIWLNLFWKFESAFREAIEAKKMKNNDNSKYAELAELLSKLQYNFDTKLKISDEEEGIGDKIVYGLDADESTEIVKEASLNNLQKLHSRIRQFLKSRRMSIYYDVENYDQIGTDIYIGFCDFKKLYTMIPFDQDLKIDFSNIATESQNHLQEDLDNNCSKIFPIQEIEPIYYWKNDKKYSIDEMPNAKNHVVKFRSFEINGMPNIDQVIDLLDNSGIPFEVVKSICSKAEDLACSKYKQKLKLQSETDLRYALQLKRIIDRADFKNDNLVWLTTKESHSIWYTQNDYNECSIYLILVPESVIEEAQKLHKIRSKHQNDPTFDFASTTYQRVTIRLADHSNDMDDKVAYNLLIDDFEAYFDIEEIEKNGLSRNERKKLEELIEEHDIEEL